MYEKEQILFIGRAHRFSPNSIDRDTAILRAVEAEVRKKGFRTTIINEEVLPTDCDAKLIFTMGRHPQTLKWLAQKEDAGIRIINSGKAMQNINRRLLLERAQTLGIDVPPHAIAPIGRCPLPYPVWWKRDDRVSQESSDVVMVYNDDEWYALTRRGISLYVVEQHVEGDLVKFYSICDTPFFHWIYPHFSKFGKETVNGVARGISFSPSLLKRQADLLAHSVGLDIYGGDAIITADGHVYIIDLNDWPSFSSCCKEAAKTIASLIEN